MREFKPKKDFTAGNYYKDRFFVNKESVKTNPKETPFKEYLDGIKTFKVLNSYVEFGQLVVFIDKEDNINALEYFKNSGFAIMSEMSGVDFTAEKNGIDVFYQLLNIEKALRVRIKCFVENKTFLKSGVEVFASLNWSERELYDMMGVWIKDHPCLGRIIMPDDWFGHPLLKSYPLHGDERARWYEVDKIFGKENREVIGEENRDPYFIDSKDTFNFSQLYHETQYGAEKRPDKPYKQEYQEKDGVAMVTKISRDKFKIIKKRR